MIKFGLKIWSNNFELLGQARDLFSQNKIHFIELYYNDKFNTKLSKLKILKGVPINIHAPDSGGFENFRIAQKEEVTWRKVKKIAGYFYSKNIILHPGREHTFKTFKQNFYKITDSRILIENMSGLDTLKHPMYASKLFELIKIQNIVNICFDLEKAIKSAYYQQINYKQFILDCLEMLDPYYFHISGGDVCSPIDEHKNLWESNFDLGWIKETLLKISFNKDIFLVFETPKIDNNLNNDMKNIEYFQNLASKS